MLDIARHKAEELDRSVLERMEFCQASIEEVAGLFSPGCFDLVLCHTLLEYVPEPREVLRVLITVLRTGGLLSVLFVNPSAEVLRSVLAKGDLDRALLSLREGVSSSGVFGVSRHSYPMEVVREALVDAGAEVAAQYGVRVFADYLPGGKLSNPEFSARLQELEREVGTLDPYRLIARYIHLVGRKVTGL
jgi:ubiquinone/menaquinone biosynthesis C-methylase UbiE